MDKSDVLERLGNPSHVAREHGLDRWAYENANSTGKETTYIFFDKGKVSYIGPAEKKDIVPPSESKNKSEKKDEGGKFEPLKN